MATLAYSVSGYYPDEDSIDETSRFEIIFTRKTHFTTHDFGLLLVNIANEIHSRTDLMPLPDSIVVEQCILIKTVL